MNKIIKYSKNTDSFIKIPQFDKNSLRLQLFTGTSFNNLPNGGSQAGQIIFLSDSRNNCYPLYWNSLKIKRVVRSTLAAETAISDGCDVTFYVNKLPSKLIHAARDSLSATAYTDNHSLHNAVHSTKQTLEKRLIVDISSMREMVDYNEVQIVWTKKDTQISDVLTIAGEPQLLLEMLESSKMLNMQIKTEKKLEEI